MAAHRIPAPLTLYYDLVSLKPEAFEREYQLLSGVDDDAIGQWLKLAKAKGDTQDTDKVLLQLLVELHRKVDTLEMLIKDEVPQREALTQHSDIEAISFEGFTLKGEAFEPDATYYGRITLPVYPQRDVGIFFKATDSRSAQFTKMHERDITDWNGYVTARERIMIREMKGLS